MAAGKAKAQKTAKSKGKTKATDKGFVEVRVVDEDDNAIPGVDVCVNGASIGSTPLQDMHHFEEGTLTIVVAKEDVGTAIREVEVKTDKITKLSFKFFGLVEKVSSLTSVASERDYGTIIFHNTLGDDTELFVTRKKEVPTAGDFEDRLTKGSGLVEISNLSVGRYELEVKLKEGSQRTELKCGNRPCKDEVTLKNCETKVIQTLKEKFDKPDGPFSKKDGRSACEETSKVSGRKR